MRSMHLVWTNFSSITSLVVSDRNNSALADEIVTHIKRQN